jgi:hypothetical protein
MVGGKVIHQLRDTSAITSALASPVNNFRKRIRGDMSIEKEPNITIPLLLFLPGMLDMAFCGVRGPLIHHLSLEAQNGIGLVGVTET